MPTGFTFDRGYAAHCAGRVVTVPDQVAEDQCGFAARGQSFPVINPAGYPWGGRKTRARIDAVATGLFTPGTGDLTLRDA